MVLFRHVHYILPVAQCPRSLLLAPALPDFPLVAFLSDRFCLAMVTATISDLLTVINEFFPLIFPFSRSLFLPLRLTSYSGVRLFLLHAFIRGGPFVLLHRRLPPLPSSPIASVRVISSLPPFPFFLRLSRVFIGGYNPEWVLHSRAPPLRFNPTTTSRGAS